MLNLLHRRGSYSVASLDRHRWLFWCTTRNRRLFHLSKQKSVWILRPEQLPLHSKRMSRFQCFFFSLTLFAKTYLSGKYIASTPAYLGSQSNQCFNQNLLGRWHRETSTRMTRPTAVWAVIWVQPTIFAPCNGLSLSARRRNAIRPGISRNESNISLWLVSIFSWLFSREMMLSRRK